MFAGRNPLIDRTNQLDILNLNYPYRRSFSHFLLVLPFGGFRNFRGSYALILLILNLFLMRNPETNEVTEITVNKFETQLAYWLDSFDGHLECIPNAQQLLHDSLLSLDEQIYNENEKKTVKAFLNSALSLTFLLKDNPTSLQKFINYKTQD
jgi:hypothetical protein